jgi:hypothetical protein
LWDVGILQAIPQRIILESPTFWSPVWWKKFLFDGFLYEAAQNFGVFSKIQIFKIKIKKSKTHSG